MALASPLTLTPLAHGQIVYPVSLTSQWQTVIGAGRVATADNSGSAITNPVTLITSALNRIISRGNFGTILCLRLGYDDGITSPTNPVIEVFGRTGVPIDGVLTYDAFGKMLNRSASKSIELALDLTNDAQDGTLSYTFCGADQQVDCIGNNEFLIGVKTAFAGTGVTTNAIVQARVI